MGIFKNPFFFVVQLPVDKKQTKKKNSHSPTLKKSHPHANAYAADVKRTPNREVVI